MLLRNGIAPTPSQGLQFGDPSNSFVFGDDRTREVWAGKDTVVAPRTPVWQHFRSFLHIQNYAQQNWTKTDPKTGKCVKLDSNTAGPLHKLEPLLSYVRMRWKDGGGLVTRQTRARKRPRVRLVGWHAGVERRRTEAD